MQGPSNCRDGDAKEQNGRESSIGSPGLLQEIYPKFQVLPITLYIFPM